MLLNSSYGSGVQLFGSADATADVGVHTMGSVFAASVESFLRGTDLTTSSRQLKTDEELGDGGVLFHGEQPEPRTNFKTDDRAPFRARQSTAIRDRLPSAQFLFWGVTKLTDRPMHISG